MKLDSIFLDNYGPVQTPIHTLDKLQSPLCHPLYLILPFQCLHVVKHVVFIASMYNISSSYLRRSGFKTNREKSAESVRLIFKFLKNEVEPIARWIYFSS